MTVLEPEPVEPEPSATPPPPPATKNRRAWWIAAAVAVLVVGGALLGAKLLSGGSNASASTRPANAVGGPNGLGRGGSFGTLQSIDGATLTVATFNGQTTAVVTTNSTKFFKSATGALSDIKVGDRVTAMGTPNGTNALTAQQITDQGNAAPGFGQRQRPPANGNGNGNGNRINRFPNGAPNGAPPAVRGPAFDPNSFANGTVKSISGDTVVVTQRDGSTKTVTTSPTTTINVFKAATLKDLVTGQQVIVTGKTDKNGTLAATSVREGDFGTAFGFGRRFQGGRPT